MKVTFDKECEVLIIGGGAIGSAIALEASSRGYKTILFEQNDFASGASSKSSKLIHGGVRYLEKAILNLDKAQYNLVKEALKERSLFLNNSMHLSKKVKFTISCKNYFELIYYYLGLKTYEFIAYKNSLCKTTFSLNKMQVSYCDGIFNDSKMVINILKKAEEFNCQVYNYSKLFAFIYKEEKLIGAKIFLKEENRYINVKANAIFNATGQEIDEIRKCDNKNSLNIATFSKGSHIVLKDGYLKNEAILIPKTSDNRVIFIIPWQNYTLVGTTEIQEDKQQNPMASKEEKEYLLNYFNSYFNTKLTQKDILSSFSGYRTLIKEEKQSQNIIREHIIEVSKTNLISIAGGKWTTFRKIGYEAIQVAIKNSFLQNSSSISKELKITQKIDIRSLKNLTKDEELLKYLIQEYASKAIEVLILAKEEQAFEKVHKDFLIIKAQILYAIKNEYAKTIVDFLARRVRVAFVDKNKAIQMVEYVGKVFAKELLWDKEKLKINIALAKKEINELF